MIDKSLLPDGQVRPIEKVACLWLFNNPIDTITAHARLANIPRETFRRAVHRLLDLGWAHVVPNDGSYFGTAIAPWMPLDIEHAIAEELLRVRHEVSNLGEWLMKCLLDMTVTDHDFHDNARPSWLVSRDGSGRMELDRWYRSAGVAFEFQGPQHYRSGSR